MDTPAVAILAGGQSRRMGRPKAHLPLGPSTLLERVLEAARSLDLPCMLIAGHPGSFAALGLPVHADLRPGTGPLGGLYTALKYTRSSTLLLLACDLPFLTPPFLRFMLRNLGAHQALVPRSNAGLQPLCALYRRSCLPLVAQALEDRELSMRSLGARLERRILEPWEWKAFDPHGFLFANLNTPEEYQRAQERVRKLEE